MIIVISEINYRRHLLGIYSSMEAFLAAAEVHHTVIERPVGPREEGGWGPHPSDYEATRAWYLENNEVGSDPELYELLEGKDNPLYCAEGGMAYEIPDGTNISFVFDDD